MAKPTHGLYVKPRSGGGINTRIGTAWMKDNGWISIQLNPCVVLSSKDDVFISLYPIEDNMRYNVPEPDHDCVHDFDMDDVPEPDHDCVHDFDMDDVPF